MKYFGTDGIRGKAETFITEDLAYSVGQSMALLHAKHVVIARDTRASGIWIVDALKRGMIEKGIDVLDLGVVPTPVLAHMSILRACYGVMVTASHNPYQDNGIKIFHQGTKTNHAQEEVIEQVIDQRMKVPETCPGKELMANDVFERYLTLYEGLLEPTSYAIGLDLANGATVSTAALVFSQIAKNVHYIGNNPNGTNINEAVGSTHIENLAKEVVEKKLDVGFSFDGDGDRVLAVDADGSIIDGDLMIYIMAVYLKQLNLLNNHLVVLTKMSNLGIIKALKRHGINVIQTDVGDKYVVEAMQKHGADLGGENSGHIINRHLFISGDGVLNAAYILHIMQATKKSIKALIEDVSMYPDKLVNVKDVDKTLVNHPSLTSLVEQIKETLGDDGKVLLRASGTESLVRISASAKTMQEVDDIIDTIKRQLIALDQERKA